MMSKFVIEKAGANMRRFLGKLGMTVVLLSPVVLSAQPGVKITGLAVEAGTVTLDVRWEPLDPPTVWSDTVWVFVDHNDNGTMKRLQLSSGATLTATSAPGVGKVEQLAGNKKGVRVIGNARSAGSFSATVQLLTATANVAGACVYASNYPPVAEYATASSITFTGTPPFDLTLNPGAISVQQGYVLLEGETLLSFTDKTGAPGIIKCIPMTGSLNFSVPSTVPKGQSTSFAVSVQPTVPAASAITYTWSAQGFSPNTYTGTTFNTTAPAAANTYPVTLTARSEGYCDLPVTNNVTVIDCVTPTTYNLIASASGFCASDAGITFSLDDTQTGVKYQLYRGSDKVGSELTGTSSGAATFTNVTDGLFKVAGTYTAQSVAESGYCAVLMTGSHPITANATPTQPTIALSSGDVCYNAGDLVFTITSYSGTPTWVNNGGGSQNGLSVKFASGASTGTKTVIAKSSQTYTNASTCHSADVPQTGTINALPAVAGSEGASRCGNGTVILNATASNDAVIDWYSVVTDGTVLAEGLATNNYTTPTLTSSKTYYAQARHTSTNCVSASRTAVGATVNKAPTAPTGLTSSASTICSGVSTSATLTATGGNLGTGAVYQWGTGDTVGENLLTPSTTTASTYAVSPSAAITYWVRKVGNTSCTGTTTGVTTSIAVYGAISPGSITTASTTTTAGTAPSVTIASTEEASGGSGNLAYEWRRSGSSILNDLGKNANYALNNVPSNYSTVGTYRFNRYAKDNTCTVYPAVAAYGTYTLLVNCPSASTVTLCTQCCYSDSAWVDCYVTTYAYPFGDCASNATVPWSGYGYYTIPDVASKGADKDGRKNTESIKAKSGTAVQLCKGLGAGWYLPAYEELYNMASHSATVYGNMLPGARRLKYDHVYWSSTDGYGNGGRKVATVNLFAVTVEYDGELKYTDKDTGRAYVLCVWRE